MVASREAEVAAIAAKLNALIEAPEANVPRELLIAREGGLRSRSGRERLSLTSDRERTTIRLIVSHGTKSAESTVANLLITHEQPPRLALGLDAVNKLPTSSPYKSEPVVHAVYWSDDGKLKTPGSMGSTGDYDGLRAALSACGCRNLHELPQKIDVQQTIMGLFGVVADIEIQAAQGDVPQSFMALFAQAYPALFNQPST